MIALKSYLKKLLFGFDLSQEYLCVGKEEVLHPLKVLLNNKSTVAKDISEQHLLLGYKPLVIGIPARRNSDIYDSFSGDSFISLFFSDEQSTNPVAELKLKFLLRKDFNDISLFIFEGVNGSHHFLSSFHKFTNRTREKLIQRKAGNINLDGNLYDQVRIAYAIPRVISIVTLGDGQQFNMFPSDLNGLIDQEHYAISLRHDGKVNQQMEELKGLCLSTVNSSFCKEAYRMGKNHMQSLKLLEEFNFSSEKSEQLKLPLPSQVLAYKELELIDSLDVGIHRLHFFKIIHEKILNSGSTLAHVHRFYASWEMKRQGKVQFLTH